MNRVGREVGRTRLVFPPFSASFVHMDVFRLHEQAHTMLEPVAAFLAATSVRPGAPLSLSPDKSAPGCCASSH